MTGPHGYLRRQAEVCLLLCTLLLAGPARVSAQTTAPQHERIRVFLDCGQCDFDYLRREIPFVDYVRDRKDADVHILATTQGTGAGGTEYVFRFIGLGRFAGVDNELKYTSLQTNTREERRTGYTRVLKLGLVRYVTSTTLAEFLNLSFKPNEADASGPQPTPETDPWNLWTFRLSGSGSMSGEESSQSKSFRTSFSGNRTTEQWKWNSNLNLNFRESLYTLSDGEKIIDSPHDHNASALLVKSLGDHWAAAVRGRWASSTFLNQERALRAGAGVEYSFFPYQMSATKELTAQVTLGINGLDYYEETIYGKTSETVSDLLFITNFDVQQPWGSMEATLETSMYLHDPARHRVELDGSFDVRLLKGLSLNMGGSVSRIRDQLYLKAGEATDEEILLRQRQLATDYRYSFSVGFSYTFGSIFNNIVNTRF